MPSFAEYKGFFESKAIWGAIVALLGSGLSLGHYTVTPADAAQLVDLLASLAGIAGSLVAIYGRIVASKKVVVTTNAATVIFALLLTGTIWFLAAIPSHAGEAAVPQPHKRVTHPAATHAAATPAPTPAPSTALSQASATANPLAVLQKLQQFALTDIQAALADAQGQTPPDVMAANCYTALLTLVGNPVASPFPTTPGAFSLFQKGRDIKNMIASINSPGGPAQALNIACAPLILDVQNTLIRLGVIGGVVAGTGGIVRIDEPNTPNLLAFQRHRDLMLAQARAE